MAGTLKLQHPDR